MTLQTADSYHEGIGAEGKITKTFNRMRKRKKASRKPHMILALKSQGIRNKASSFVKNEGDGDEYQSFSSSRVR